MQTSELPLSIQIVQALGPSLVAIVVGCVAAYVAYRQYKTAKDKLRLDLFEKRYTIYLEVKAILANTLQHGTVTYEEISDFYRKVRSAELLFGPEIEAFIELLRTKLNSLAYHEGQVRAFNRGDYDDEPTYQGHVDSAHDIMLEVEPLLVRQTRQKFEPYLSFSHLK
jgi:hypothetical protein